ncbi:hypothetical protein ACHAWF_013005 [Thalassiosira exigua]
MISARKAENLKEIKQPFGSGFLSFIKKPEVVNIFFAFVCVLLAYQIHGMRAGIRKLLAENEEKDAEISRLRGVLASMSGGGEENREEGTHEASFASKLAQKCAGVVRRIFEESEKRAGYSWILGKKLASGDALELENLAEELQPVILTEVQSAVGDAAFTPEELKERRVDALKAVHEATDVVMHVNNTRKGDAQMGGLMEILEEVHNQDLTDEQNAKSSEEAEGTPSKVRRTRYAI